MDSTQKSSFQFSRSIASFSTSKFETLLHLLLPQSFNVFHYKVCTVILSEIGNALASLCSKMFPRITFQSKVLCICGGEKATCAEHDIINCKETQCLHLINLGKQYCILKKCRVSSQCVKVPFLVQKYKILEKLEKWSIFILVSKLTIFSGIKFEIFEFSRLN